MIWQINFKLCNITLQFMELNAFSTSNKRTAPVSTSGNISFMGWAAASSPTSWPALSCNDPAAFVISFLHNILTALPAILLSASPTPVGLKPGFLSNSINLLAVEASRDCGDCSSSAQSFLMKFPKALRRYLKNFQIAYKLIFFVRHQHLYLMVLNLLLLALLFAWPNIRWCHHMRLGELV